MKWFRSNIESGARLALLALFVQLALSFGHVHALAAPSAHSTTALNAAATADAGNFAVDSPAASQQAPAGKHDSDQRGPDGCAICAVMAMAGTVLFSSPPVLLLPEAVEFLYRTTDAEFAHLKSAGNSFQPRGPPAS
jgi:hypothetical protein